MTILPVLDILEGVVVRGVAGHREAYRPLESEVCRSPEPLAVARALRQCVGHSRVYVADLDGIMHARPQWDVLQRLSDDGFELVVDGGVRALDDAVAFAQRGAARVIVGLETAAAGPELLSGAISALGRERVVFGLDLIEGVPAIPSDHWEARSAMDVAELAINAGAESLIVLELRSVGSRGGLSTLSLCADLRLRHPDIELIAGGGVRHADDLVLAAAAGIDQILVASALHDGGLTIPPHATGDSVRRFLSPQAHDPRV